MDLNNSSDTDFNRKKKPLAGTNEIGLGANQHPETWIPQQPSTPSLAGTAKQPLGTENLYGYKPLVSTPEKPKQLFAPPAPVDNRNFIDKSISNDLSKGAFTDKTSRFDDTLTSGKMGLSSLVQGTKDVGNAAVQGISNAAAYAFLPKGLSQSSSTTTPTPLAGTQPLRNVQVPDLNTPQVARSLHQMANRPSLVGTKTSVDQMMNTTTLPPATTGTQAAMSPVNSPNRITSALNDPNNYHEHLMQNAKNAGIDKFQPNLNYADDMNARGGARKLVGTQDSPQQAPVTQRLVGTANGQQVFKDSNGVTSMNGKVINDGK